MALGSGNKIDNADIVFQTISEGSKITAGQLDTNYYDVTQTSGSKIYAPTLKRYSITMATNDSSYGTTSIDDSSYTVSTSSQTRTITASPASGYELESWSTTKGSISGSTLTIPSKAYGNFTVTGTFKSSISTTLNDNSWSTIHTVAQRGTAANYWSVGDYKNVSVASGTVDQMTVNANTYRAVILGFNHNPDWEDEYGIDFCIGQNTSGNDILFFNSKGVRMTTSADTPGGWVGSAMYTTFLPQFYNLLSENEGLQSAMIAPKKWTHNAQSGTGNQSEANVTLSGDKPGDAAYKLFLLSEFEVFGALSEPRASSYEPPKQAQYAYYSSSGLGKSKVRYRTDDGSAFHWWERSMRVYSNAAFYQKCYACGVHKDGTARSFNTNGNGTGSKGIDQDSHYFGVNGAGGLVPCFRV